MTVQMITILLWLSVPIQGFAAFLALRLIPVSGRAHAWIIISFALILMMARRLSGLLFSMGVVEDVATVQLLNEILALTISVMLASGVFLIRGIFLDLDVSHSLLDQTHREWAAAIEAMREPIFLHDAGLKLVGANRAYLSQAGKENVAEILGLPYWEVFPRLPGPLKGCLEGMELRGMTEEEIHVGERDVFVSRTYPIHERDGRTLSLHVLDNITSQRQLEQQLRSALAEKEALVSQLDELATHDGLTGLLNYRAFHARLEEEVERSLRYRQPLALLMLDLDHFKLVNDLHGHLAGDAVLRRVAEVLRRQVRSVDSICRYGGEEMCIILPLTGRAEARTIAERVRESIEATMFGEEDVQTRVTASIGVASLPDEAGTAVDLVAAADRMLYEAKAAGRNRVAGAGEG